MKGNFFGKINPKRTGLLVFILLVLACNLPPLSQPPSPSSASFTNHMLVSLTDPQDGDAFPISAGLSLRSEIISDSSIARLELWANGTLVEKYPAPEKDLGYLVHYWSWSPQTIGWHTLMVRAYNDQEQTSFSNVVNIEGIEDPGFVLMSRVEDGHTAAATSELGAISLLAVEQNDVANADFPAQARLTAPSLQVSHQGCEATLVVTDSTNGEKGFNLYRLNPGAPAFTKIKSLPAHTGGETFSYKDPNLYGLYQYYVTAFDESGETASNLVSLNSTDVNCAGVPVKIDDLASIPAGVEDYYLYVTINNSAWRRFPADEFTFLKRSQDMDFNQVATSLAPNLKGNFSMRGEVWGMVNGTAALLGTFDKSFKSGQAPSMVQATGFQNLLKTKLEVRGVYNVSLGDYLWATERGMSYDTQLFRFGTDTQAQYGLWQVASVPFAPGADFKPACLLLTGKTSGSGPYTLPVTFNIDFSPLKPQIQSVTLSPFENSYSQVPAFYPPFKPDKLTPSGQQAVTQPKWNSGKVSTGNNPVMDVMPSKLDPCAKNVSAEGAVTYYVRIIPMSNEQPAGDPSNTVVMTYDPNGQIQISIPHVPIPNLTYYDVKILNFTGVHVPDLTYEFCVVIVENKYIGLNPKWLGTKPGDVICPESDQGGNKDFLEEISEAVADAFNFVSGLYNKLSDWVTDLVEKLNPLCIQAKLASQAVEAGEGEVKDACHFIAVAAVTAAKTYAGLPPSLPNFDEITEIGKDNLVELAAQELEDQGIPCPEDCKDVIRKGIDYSLDQVKAGLNNSSCMSEQEAGEHGIKPLCAPEGIITKPDPRGQPAPAVLEVEITRRPGTTGENIPEPKSCSVTVDSFAVNSYHLGKSYSTSTGFHWDGAKIEGNLLTGSGAFPNLQPGKSTKIPIILSAVPYWLPGHWEFAKTNWQPEHFDDWGLLYQGATATINAGGTCQFEFPEGTGFSDVAVTGDSTQVGPLGGAWSPTCHPYNCP